MLVQGLATEQMTGENAYENMYHLDFEHIWHLTDGYPVLQWQDAGNKIPTPEISRITVEPLSIFFGFLQPGSTKSRNVIIRNNGTGQINGEISLAGNESEVFRILEGDGSFSLSEEAIHVVKVEFVADQELFKESLLVIELDMTYRETPLWISLNGIGGHPVSVEQEDQALVKSIKLHQNYPNPFNPVTVIPFSVAGQAHVRLSVYNMLGRHVSTLVNEIRSPGWHDVTFDATELSSGLYIYRLEADGNVETRSMMLVK